MLSFPFLSWTVDHMSINGMAIAVKQDSLKYCAIHALLDSKPFSPEYWKWQHRYLIYAVRQYGYPSLFITISPYEWSFTRPLWIQQLMSTLEHPPHSIPFSLKYHFRHTLEQVIRVELIIANGDPSHSAMALDRIETMFLLISIGMNFKSMGLCMFISWYGFVIYPPCSIHE